MIAQTGFCCECVYRDIKSDTDRSVEIIAGEVLGFSFEWITVRVMKSWKGVVKSKVYTIANHERGCHSRVFYPTEKYHLIYLDSEGIDVCSRTIDYTKTSDIPILDSMYVNSIWINRGEIGTLARLEYKRKYLIPTEKGMIDVRDKNVLFYFAG